MKLADYLYFNKLTIGEMAKKIGMSREHLGKIVSGKQIPSVPTARKIEEATDGQVSAIELVLLNIPFEERKEIKNQKDL